MSDKDAVKGVVFDIVKNRLGVDPDAVGSLGFKDLGLENFDKIMLTICLEDHYEFMLPDEQIDKTESLDQIIEIVCQALEKKACEVGVQKEV